ncbi:LolA family protein [Natronobacterium gregoryi]|nr:DUF2092 domain-containing protein [Natronobacterium gregoryi]AFZ71881.1 outer membrane lipoprotein-sorting protein [Natronobacterium gregoryi SP2]PLK19400.1 outer membrane lipoprotein carrier protein LolA [Natronobacterium gregoryi SP2]SFJ51260.1 Outer membrane lipoprotein-sorting protein [Natronobacterium gregoryi]
MIGRRLVAVFAVLAVLAVLGGFTALEPHASERDEPMPKELFESVFVHADDLESVHGDRTTEIVVGTGSDAETHSQRVEVVERPYTEYRSEVLESADPDRVGDVYVSTASINWWYDPDANVADYFAPTEPFDDDAVRADRADHAERQQRLSDLEYEGVETVADRKTHVLTVEAETESATDGVSVLVGDTEFVYALETVDPSDELEVHEQRLWIDAEYEFPLKQVLVLKADTENERYVMTEQFESVTFNGDVDEETFAFEPPENATVTDLGGG